jgi:nicotinate-nucleotide adenylyltransferase
VCAVKRAVDEVNFHKVGGVLVRVAVFGGSFNPPHVGHAMVTQWLLSTNMADEVWLLPTVSHALGKSLPPFAKRVAWCRALAAGLDARVQVNEIEMTLSRPSFSINTLRALQARHPDTIFRLVVGSDILDETDAWHEWDAIVAEFTPIIVGRAGYPVDGVALYFPEVSSSDIRTRVAEGRSVDGLVPHAVLDAMDVTE